MPRGKANVRTASRRSGPPPARGGAGIKRPTTPADTGAMSSATDRHEAVPAATFVLSNRRRRRSHAGRFLLDALLGASLMVVVHVFFIQVSVVKGNSMEPCLHDGDRLVVDRVSYSLGGVGRGDVVVMRYPRNPDVDFVKRIVGIPGDRIAMDDGVLYVNGAPCDDYGSIHDRQDLAEFTVPEAQFFVLGDNRPISCDSREFGLVAQDLLKGKVRVRFWPLANASVF